MHQYLNSVSVDERPAFVRGTRPPCLSWRVAFLVLAVALPHALVAQAIHVVPAPREVRVGQGAYVLTANAQILVASSAKEGTDRVGAHLASWLRPGTGFPLSVVTGADAPANGAIFLDTNGAPADVGNEGYRLEITVDRVVIRANTPAGLFYGAQTLRQLFPPAILARKTTKPPLGTWRVPAVTITDAPRFSWRGMHLDDCRHFQGKAFVKRYLDQMAMHKLNTFHWHLTEDQGWRIEIKKYPELTAVGARRHQTPILHDRNTGDGKPYGPFFYTQDDVREIVAYAADRFITVVPEIEMPGHAQAAIAAYPWLGPKRDAPLGVRWRWGISQNVYNVDDRTFAFLEDVINEVVPLFPGTFFHVGGDECPKKQWKASASAQKRIKDEGLKDEHELQSYFIRRIEKILSRHGKRLIGWDEILEGGLAPNATVMSWRGTKGGLAAAKAGHDVVMSPTTHCYFDYYQSKDKHREPPAIGGFLPVEKVYSFEPVPAELSADKAKHVLGAQGNVWTEYIPSGSNVEYMAWPRACALAERVWSPKTCRDFAAFKERLAVHLKRFDQLGVNYRRLDP